MCANFQTKRTTLIFFCPNLPKNGFRVGNSENQCLNKNQHSGDNMCANFQAEQTILTFFAQICTKVDIGLEIQKAIVGIRISIFEIPLCQFSDKTRNFDFSSPNLPKNRFWRRNFKSQILDSESAPPRYHVC